MRGDATEQEIEMQASIGILILMITSGFLVLRVFQSRSTAVDKVHKAKTVTGNIQKPWGW